VSPLRSAFAHVCANSKSPSPQLDKTGAMSRAQEGAASRGRIAIDPSVAGARCERLQSAATAAIRRLGHHPAAQWLGVDPVTLLNAAIGEPVAPAQRALLERLLLAGGGP